MNWGSKILEHKLWRSGGPLDYVETMPRSEGSPLEQIYKQMQKHDEGVCGRWRDEIQQLLIFAGLFSATVTAFIIDSYKRLQPDDTKMSAQLLSQISLQLNAIANNATPVSASTILDEAFVPTPRNVRVTIFWFSSLVLCLSTVIFGILCLQWIREFTRDISLYAADCITIRQMRYEGLLRWKVPAIVHSLPIILQTSVLLFFAGVLDFLWSVNETVAATIMAIICLVTVGIVFTTAAPVVQTIIHFRHLMDVGNDPQAYVAPCPYRSPLSWFFLRIIVMILDPVPFKQRFPRSSWAEFDIFSYKKSMRPSRGKKAYNAKGLARTLKWIMAKLLPELNQDITRDVFHLLHDVIDRSTTGAVLLNWAELTGEARELEFTLKDLRGSGMYQALYDLLMERLLRKASPVQENRKVLLELQVRCLNTLGDRKMADVAVGETFSEAARNCYYYLIENEDASCLDEDGLLFQSLMTIMKFYNRFYNHQRMPGVADCVGSVIAAVIRRTQIKGHNASFCYQILNQFKPMLEGVYQRVGDFSSQNPNANLRCGRVHGFTRVPSHILAGRRSLAVLWTNGD
ncbi:hypothetical protein JOM56_014408 [Amanita muscaria]